MIKVLLLHSTGTPVGTSMLILFPLNKTKLQLASVSENTHVIGYGDTQDDILTVVKRELISWTWPTASAMHRWLMK